MPCVDGREDYDRMKREQAQRTMKDRLDTATRVACEMSKCLSEMSIRKLSGEAQSWIAAHRRDDALRERANLDPHKIENVFSDSLYP